ncbi:MAG: Hsp20/alpha crystallin family protein [Verrucomicrobiota bacterium]
MYLTTCDRKSVNKQRPTVNQFLDAFFDVSPEWNTGARTYTHVSDEAYSVLIDVPGVRKEDLKLRVENNTLYLETDRKFGFTKDEQARTTKRSYAVPDDVNVDAINAELSDGVLRLTLPKKEEAKPRNVDIKIK